MTQNLTSIIDLITRGLAATGAVLNLERLGRRNPAMRDKMRMEYLISKAQLQALAEALRSRTLHASAADMEMALLHISSPSDKAAWTALIEKLSASKASDDQEMAKALGMFA